MRLIFHLLAVLCVVGCHTAGGQRLQPANAGAHQLFLRSRSPMDGEYAEQYAYELLAMARRIGPQAFVSQLRREDRQTQTTVAQLLLPLAASLPRENRLQAELEKLMH